MSIHAAIAGGFLKWGCPEMKPMVFFGTPTLRNPQIFKQFWKITQFEHVGRGSWSIKPGARDLPVRNMHKSSGRNKNHLNPPFVPPQKMVKY